MKILLINNGVPPPGNPALKKSFRSMAKELGVDQGTVRKRMRRLQEQRILKGWYLGINPGLVGQDVLYAWFEIDKVSDKEKAIERLLSLPSLERVCSYFGSKLKMVLLCDKGTESGKVVNQLVRMAGPKAILRHHAFLKVPVIPQSETDLEIIGSLRRNPWKPYSTVADELGLSARTVKRRVERLSRDGEIYMLPNIDLKALQGMIPVDLIVDYVSEESRSAVNERVTSHILSELMFTGRFGPTGYFSLWAPNVSRVEHLEEWVRRQTGVLDAQADLLQDVILNRAHFEREWMMTTNRVAADAHFIDGFNPARGTSSLRS